jgi:ABC-type oligopeptide transport system substrate-binding subunit
MKKRFLITSLILMVLLMSAFVLTGCSNNDAVENNNEVATNGAGNETNDPADTETTDTEAAIMGADAVTVDELTTFDPLAGVTATGTDGADATADIEVAGTVNTLMAGEYELTYTVKGTDVSVTRVVTVNPVEATLASGVLNYKFAPAETRHTFMAAAENWLLHNQAAGVPLFANAGFNLYSTRMQLASEAYLPVLGFGTMFSTMAADDSKVMMEDGEMGNEGEYTYRIAISGNPTTWNQWLSDDGTTSDIMDEYLGNLFVYEFNEDKSGYVLAPSMAAENPTPVDSRMLPSGKEVSNVWQIKIKDGLEWKFNDTTDTSMVTDYKIDANDFYETYKIALTEQWFRAISGGGDFVTGKPILNAQEFVDGTAEWEDVGIKLIDDNTIELHFVEEQSQWNVKYSFADTTMMPIHTELYEALGDEYGTNENTIGYTGVYFVEYYENDKIIRYTKNELYPDADKYFYTGKTFNVIADSEMRFQEFLAGKLDAASLPSAHYEDYKSHPGLKRVPGTTTFRLMINGLGNTEAQAEQFPDSEWVPEPILSNVDFKMGIFHAIDRKKLAEEVMKTSQTQMYLFTDAYVVEAEAGIPYRATPQGLTVGADLSPSTFGYNLDAAKAYYEQALDTLVAEGVYAAGDEIVFEFYFFSGSETQELLGAYLKKAMEEAFQSEKHNINVTVEPIAKDFPGIYYDHMMVGEFDTSVGGISGSSLDAASFLDTYCSDNRGYFTLNWGIDTTQAEIEVAYTNDAGELVKELWSFDAITSVLVGEVEVADGVEVIVEEEETTTTE